ncbi:protein of unknown function [Modestobacter italicus]|uniref:Uncharacterized protein n=1 Tax=Modestobacter italicus (strain DSM 44449 / CECT 9708 / BC 501) TaxID=2732864 RepID=I4ESK9_MODI5|nr:protein of unknown function [Modestobacter marinus]
MLGQSAALLALPFEAAGAAEEVEEELLEESLLPPEDSLLLLPLDSLAAAGVLALSALRLSVR